MADYNVLREAREAAQNNMADAVRVADVDTAASVYDQLQELMDDFSAPEVIYYHQGWDVVNDSQAPELDEKPDFSGCESATAAVMLEANMVMDVAYRNEVNELIEIVADALDDAAAEAECEDWQGGGAGLDHLSHLREFDAGQGNVCHWRLEGRDVYELTISGVKFHAVVTPDDDE